MSHPHPKPGFNPLALFVLFALLAACTPLSTPAAPLQASPTLPACTAAPPSATPLPSQTPAPIPTFVPRPTVTANALLKKSWVAFLDQQSRYTLQMVSGDGNRLTRLYPRLGENESYLRISIRPVWSADGSALYFLADGVLYQVSDPSQDPPSYSRPPGSPEGAYSVFSLSPDGKYLAAAYKPSDEQGERLGLLDLSASSWIDFPIATWTDGADKFSFSALAWSPDNQHFTFSALQKETAGLLPLGPTRQMISYRRGAGSLEIRDLFVAGVDGSLTNLTQGTDRDGLDPDQEAPVWSPEGSRIYYLGVDGEQWGVFSVHPDGSQRTLLTNFKHSQVNFILPSPDGARLLYQSSVNDLPGLYQMESDGANPTHLAQNDFARSDWAPAWSPDGSRILISCLGEGSFDLCLLNASDGKLVHIMNVTDPNSHPAWSPDGKMIAFVAAKDRDPDIADKYIRLWGIYVVNIDDSGLRRLQVVKDPSLVYPVWSR
jgi:Tol biopolymer transport system component